MITGIRKPNRYPNILKLCPGLLKMWPSFPEMSPGEKPGHNFEKQVATFFFEFLVIPGCNFTFVESLISNLKNSKI